MRHHISIQRVPRVLKRYCKTFLQLGEGLEAPEHGTKPLAQDVGKWSRDVGKRWGFDG